jgi:predicted AAA+ superfamily ATPase
MFKISSVRNPLSAELTPLDNQVVKTDEPLPQAHIVYIIAGRRGSGKSSMLLQLLKRKSSPYHRFYDNIMMCSPTASRDPKFDKLVEELQREDKFYDTLNDDVINDIVERLKEFNDAYKEEHPKSQPHNLLILDDCIHLMGTSNAHSSLNQLFSNGRHLSLTLFICTQKLNKLSTLCRSQADLISFFPNDNQKEFDTLEHEWNIDPKLLKAVYNYATDEPNSFLHISLFGRRPQFFKRFDKIEIE